MQKEYNKIEAGSSAHPVILSRMKPNGCQALVFPRTTNGLIQISTICCTTYVDIKGKRAHERTHARTCMLHPANFTHLAPSSLCL
uniref:Uncharacterized protein n=1 Tax=Arundo donax TaxID=35708 RepID=A0A0A9B840_ARUDO